jgi:hypothetical protein
VRYLTREGGPQDGFWIHLDADVFDETIMQAVDDPRPDGLAWNEAVSALSVAVRSGRAVGLQVAIYIVGIDTTDLTAADWPQQCARRLARPPMRESSRRRGPVFDIRRQARPTGSDRKIPNIGWACGSADGAGWLARR